MSESAAGSGTAHVRGAAVTGIDGHLLDVIAQVSPGPPGLCLTGLPVTAIRETRDRVRAAVINSGFTWPGSAITITVQPAGLARHGTGTDLAIAVAVLTAAGELPVGAADRCVLVGELGLDGRLRPVRGVAPALRAAASTRCARAVVAMANGPEAVIPGLDVLPCASLGEVVTWLRGGRLQPGPVTSDTWVSGPAPGLPLADAAGLAVTPLVRLGLEASAAGGHHLCLTGRSGSGIPAVAAGVARLLPPLSPQEASEVTAIHSAAGLLGSGHALVTRPPFRVPHHTATPAAVAGGGPRVTRPGEASLAHRGVLFLDDAPEFARHVLEVLREPLQDGQITIARSGIVVRFPARILLVAGMTPCPCGGLPGCTCTPLQARRYRARLTGILGRCLPIHLTITPPASTGAVPGDDGDSAARVAAARDRARHRLRGTGWQLNAEVPGPELQGCWAPPAEAMLAVSRAVDLGEISGRAANQILRVAWTLADLAGQDRPGPQECGQALAFYLGVSR